MSDSSAPSGGDRSRATSIVDAALKSGRIVQADRDMRIAQIKGASTKQDLDLVVRDLQAPGTTAAPPVVFGGSPSAGAPATGAPVPGAPATGQQPWPLVNYGPGQHGLSGIPDVATVVGKAGKRIGGMVLVIVFLSVIIPIVGVIIGLVSARDNFDSGQFGEPVDETTYLPGQAPGDNGVNVHTVEGYDDLVAALSDKTGATSVFSATLYPRYAVLDVPEQATGKRYRSYYWDGRTLVANDIKSTTDNPRIDLSTVDPSVLVTLLDDVRGRIEKPTSWYVNIDSLPSGPDAGPRLSIFSSNEYSETAYIIADLDGTITYESEPPA